MVLSVRPGASNVGEHRGDVAVDVAQAIQVVVVPPTPACFFVRDVADQRVVRTQEIAVRRRAARRVKRLHMVRRKLEVPLLGIQRIDRIARDMLDAALCLDHRARGIGVVVHHIVRVDQVDREEPRLAFRRQLAPLAAQPAPAHRGDDRRRAGIRPGCGR